MADETKTYEDFLQLTVKRCWERGPAARTSFLALMLATRHAWSEAASQTFKAESGKKALTGAAGLAAVAVAARMFLSGPLGLLLAGASVASLVATFGKNQAQVVKKVRVARRLVDAYEPRFEELAGASDSARELMMEGLVSRFLAELDEAEEPEEKPEAKGFKAHVARSEAAKQEE